MQKDATGTSSFEIECMAQLPIAMSTGACGCTFLPIMLLGVVQLVQYFIQDQLHQSRLQVQSYSGRKCTSEVNLVCRICPFHLQLLS